MAKALKGFRKALVIILGVVAGIVAALEIFIKTPLMDKVVAGIIADNIDADVAYDDIDIHLFSSFPCIRVDLDSLVVTYPHDRFAAFDKTAFEHPLLEAGRGEDADTLAALGRFTVAVNPWRLIGGTLRVNDVHIGGLELFAKSYNDSTANWGIFPQSEEPEDTTSSSLPLISIGEFVFDNPARLVYSALPSEIALDVPVHRLELSGSFKKDEEVLTLRDILLDARLAHIPLKAAADVTLLSDSTYIKGNVAIEECPLDTLLTEYGTMFTDLAYDVETDARLTLTAEADGYLTSTALPDVTAGLSIPDSRVAYLPMGIDGRLELDLEATARDRKKVDAEVTELKARMPGLRLRASGEGSNLLGNDPGLKLSADVRTRLDSLIRMLPDLGILASGDVSLDLFADAHVSELNQYKFRKATIRGSLEAPFINFRMPADTLLVATYEPRIDIGSDPEGILLKFNMDSVFLDMGGDLRAKVKDMKNTGRLYKADNGRGEAVPRIEFESDNGSIFFRSGDTRARVRTASIAAAVEKRAVRARPGADSLARGTHRRDSLGRRMRGDRPAGDSDEIRGGNVKIELDSTIKAYLKQWSPSGRLALGKGFLSTPALPLRTRIGAVSANFTDRELSLDTLDVTCGTSSLRASGSVDGLMPLLTGRGRGDRVTKLRLGINSGRINLNEIIAAVQQAPEAPADTSLDYDESFVIDTLENARPEINGMDLVIVPGNIDAEVKLSVDRVDFTDIRITPFNAEVNLRDRTLQLLNTNARTDFGKASLDAYYSTKTKSDINAGVDIAVDSVLAQEVIAMLPGSEDMLPIVRSFEGNVGLKLSATTQLDTNMNVVIPSVDGIFRLTGRDLRINDAGDFRKITRLLLFKNKNIGDIADLDVNAVIHDSKLEVFPFQISADRYKFALRGMQGLDRTMYYHVSLLKAPLLLPIGVNVYGTLDNWRFYLGFPKYKDGKMPAFTQQLDSVRININQSIRNIFSRGVKQVSEYNSRSMKALEQSKKAQDDTQILTDASPESLLQADELYYRMQIEEMDAAIEAEVDAILEESMSDTEKLLQMYQEEIYDKGIEERIARLKKQSEARN